MAQNNRSPKQPSKLNIQSQIRNAGTNRATGKADHLHRGDRRDMQDAIAQNNKGQDGKAEFSPRAKPRGYRGKDAGHVRKGEAKPKF